MQATKRLALLFLLALPLGGRAETDRIPVLLSTDVGNEIDDQWAITWLLLEPRLDVRGVMSAHAPSIAAPAGSTSLRILRDVVEARLGMRSHPPLIEGGSVPLKDAHTPQPSPAVSFLLETSRAFSRSNRLTVLAIGASTDVASAILTDRTVVDRIRVVQMGFVDETSGKEFNIENDIHAEQVLLDSEVPLTIGPASVCRRDLAMTYDHAREYLAARGPIGAWLWEEYDAWYFRFVKPLRVDDFSKPWYIWDDITLAYALGLTEQHTTARPHLSDAGMLGDPDSKRSVTWITRVDSDRLWSRFATLVDGFEQSHAMPRAPAPNRLSIKLP